MTTSTTRPAGCLPAILILLAAAIVALVLVPAAQTITARADTPAGDALGLATAALPATISPSPAVTVLVATPTPGPDYAATAGYYAIQSSANEAAGQANYATAAAIERNRQAGLSTATIQAVTRAANQQATEWAAALTPTAQAIVAQQTAAAAGSTRTALVLTETAAPLQTAAAHAHELTEIEQAREIERTRTRAWLRAWFWPLAWPALALALMLALAVFALRLVFQYDLVDGLLAIIERITGKYPPAAVQEPFSREIAPVPVDPELEKRLSSDEQNVLRMLAAALAAEQDIERQRAAGKRVAAFSLSRNQTEQHGYTGGGDGWTRARDWLMSAGLVIPVNGGQAHIPAGGRSVEKLYHLVVGMLASMTAGPPYPNGSGAVPVPDMLAEHPARDTGRGRGVEP